ncbi:hypothetical protein BT93_C0978 [Corymbia citriodora subsp. variegata]|nr:hypothetical protein BT93_C0978 [Corymbia citriodora subsp. variegata]
MPWSLRNLNYFSCTFKSAQEIVRDFIRKSYAQGLKLLGLPRADCSLETLLGRDIARKTDLICFRYKSNEIQSVKGKCLGV